MLHSNWRDCDAWRKENLPMSSTSNEACKLFDVVLSQIVGLYENKQFNGLVESLNSLVNADSQFVLGNCLKLGIELLGSNALLNNQKFYEENFVLNTDASSFLITEREKLHVKAIQKLYRGCLPQACQLWEDILIENPTDMMAIRFAHSAYFYLGQSAQMRDSIARVIPFWQSKGNLPLNNYLYGMHAFGLAETNRIDQARENALKSLELEPRDAWASHALCHVNEYTSNSQNG